jgi:hypothetical protein
MRCDAMRCDAMRCDAMRYVTLRYVTLRYVTRGDAMRCDAMRCDTVCYVLVDDTAVLQDTDNTVTTASMVLLWSPCLSGTIIYDAMESDRHGLS